MRIITLFILLVCIAATVVPCCRFDNCSDEVNTTAASGEKDREEGNCSPFFTCASCPTGVITTKAVEINTPIIILTSYHLTHHSSDLSSYTYSFWQPPRLG